MTDYQPVVLDLGADAPQYARFLREIISHWPYNEQHMHGGTAQLQYVLDAIEETLPKPRIPQPGLWGVVATGMDDGSSVDYWTHGYGGWFNERGQHAEWDSLDNPNLVREGVQS